MAASSLSTRGVYPFTPTPNRIIFRFLNLCGSKPLGREAKGRSGMPKRNDSGDLQNFCANAREIIGAGFAIAVIAVVTALLFMGGTLLIRIIWPRPDFAIDNSVLRLADTLAWPAVAALIAFFAVTSKSLHAGAQRVFERIRTMKAGSYEVSFSEDGARRLKRDLEESLEEFQDQSKVEYTRSARTHRVSECLRSFLNEILRVSRELELPDEGGIKIKNIKATIHIRDVVFDESLYQLVDYIPSGRGAGRRFSVRYGAIGISLRSETDSFWNANDPANTIESLIVQWGMTNEEASHAVQSEFALCLVLRDDRGVTSGVFFIKANSLSHVSNAVTAEKQKDQLTKLLNRINEDRGCATKRCALAKAVSEVYEDVASSGTFISVYK